MARNPTSAAQALLPIRILESIVDRDEVATSFSNF